MVPMDQAPNSQPPAQPRPIDTFGQQVSSTALRVALQGCDFAAVMILLHKQGLEGPSPMLLRFGGEATSDEVAFLLGSFAGAVEGAARTAVGTLPEGDKAMLESIFEDARKRQAEAPNSGLFRFNLKE